jgi:hypothetical protein
MIEGCHGAAPGLAVAGRAPRGHEPTTTAFLAVEYRNHWYYIDDRDQQSKATFALVGGVSRLDFGRPQPGGAYLTLPVGR